MLENQRSNKSVKDKLSKVMRELHFKAPKNYKGINIPAKPPKVTGYIYKIGKMLHLKNRRYFEMDPVEGNFIKYKNKDAYPKNPKEIYCINDIKTLNRLPNSDKQKFQYFDVMYIDKIVHLQ